MSTHRTWLVILLPGLFLVASVSIADENNVLDRIEGAGEERIRSGQYAQSQVDALAVDNRRLINDYQAELKIVDGLRVYTTMLGTQLEGQHEEVELLHRSIADVAVIERQVLPLLVRMLDSLQDFVAADIPFLLEERTARVEKLRSLLNRSDVTTAEKARRVFEAYEIENEYGRTIEAYTNKLDLDGAHFDAEFLRVGRVALLYRTIGAEQIGRWSRRKQDWQALESGRWSRAFRSGLRVARQEVAPALMTVPIDSEEVLKR